MFSVVLDEFVHYLRSPIQNQNFLGNLMNLVVLFI